MKQLIIEELPNVVSQLYDKMERMETFIRKEVVSYKNFDFSQNVLFQSKCGSHYNKSDLAQLFYILMDENILFFDGINEKCNRGKMQKFVQENFTYKGDSGYQVTIDTISKQFSESKGFTYKEKQLKFLDKIILQFEKRREKLVKK